MTCCQTFAGRSEITPLTMETVRVWDDPDADERTKIWENTACLRQARYLYCALFRLESLFMRRPKGIKTKKSVSKRFKITATGKVLRSSAGRRHLCQGKRPKRRRALRGAALVHSTDEYRIKQSLPFTR